MAASRRQELNIPPDVAAQLGKSAVEAARAGYYVNQAGEQVDWRSAVEGARLAKKVSRRTIHCRLRMKSLLGNRGSGHERDDADGVTSIHW